MEEFDEDEGENVEEMLLAAQRRFSGLMGFFPSPEEQYLDKELWAWLNDGLDKLEPRQGNILASYYGLSGWNVHKKTYEDVGEEFDISPSQARVIANMGIVELRRCMRGFDQITLLQKTQDEHQELTHSKCLKNLNRQIEECGREKYRELVRGVRSIRSRIRCIDEIANLRSLPKWDQLKLFTPRMKRRQMRELMVLMIRADLSKAVKAEIVSLQSDLARYRTALQFLWGV